ncbi:MarR family winged helix-turn-helix transcriptional regulator [Blastopirellula retiformator]|uniref:Transcriptional regulator SlyA n=1 Tax=Blastopirellula retiformator TaxID=2527970 RepID=A0A5C5VPW1_9BACT|nr:MarR family transcriptional regulator [Blastopirellula retiformator]TWT39662.1 Transcriptional regulator SlyA [Blastopirellula retiformator]
MIRFDFEKSVGYWIFSTGHMLSRAMNEELSTHGITYRQWEVLAWLSYHGEITQSELAEQMRIEAPTLVGVIDRMERDGWITRETDPCDRRKKIIRATDKVRPVWEQMVNCALSVRARAIVGIPEEDLEVMRRTLSAMRDNMGENVLGPVPTNTLVAPTGPTKVSNATSPVD